MSRSRLGRYEERRERKKILLALTGTVVIILFLGVFGVKLLEGFSLFLVSLRGTSPQQQPSLSIILAPVLDPPPEATNSAMIAITGHGQPDLAFILYVNEKEFKKVPVPKDGNVTIENVTIVEGENTISAKLTDDKGNLSDLSNVVTTTVKKGKPTLDVSAPPDSATLFGDKNTVTVSGKTDAANQVTINDRLAVVRNDGSFDYALPLHEGENILKIVATDTAGNQESEERRVTYQK